MQIETQRKQGQQHLPETKQILQKSIKKNKEGHYIVTKGSIQEEDITLVNIYTLNTGALSTTFGFFFFFFQLLLGGKLGCLFDVFLVSQGRLVLQYASFSALLLVCPIGFELSCFIVPCFQVYFDFLFYFFSDLLVIQKHVKNTNTVASTFFCFLQFFFLQLMYNLIAWWSEKMLEIISIFKKFAKA